MLIVDDNVEAAQILAEAAKMVGCDSIETVASGEDAIGKAIMVDYDLITMDIRMPGVSGLDALSVTRGLRPHTIFAVVSAYTRDIDPESTAAADVVLPKPVSLEKFQQMLKLTEEIGERRQAIRDLGES